MSSIDIDAVLNGYVTCALWSETHEITGEPLDATYTRDDVSFGSITCMREDVEAFVNGCLAERADVFHGIDAEQIGHDFWLTRNGHGAGFWDRGLGERGDWLTSMCKPYGEARLWTCEDGRVYYQN